MNTLFGFNIVEARPIPRYVLPDEVIPGVPWPAGFRDDINTWSLAFLGASYLMSEGQAFIIGGHTVVVRPSTAAALRAAAPLRLW